VPDPNPLDAAIGATQMIAPNAAMRGEAAAKTIIEIHREGKPSAAGKGRKR